MKIEQHGAAYVATLESVTEFANAWDIPEHAPGGWGHLESHFNDSAWMGASSKEEARDLLVKGWKDGADKVSALKLGLGEVPKGSSRRQRTPR